MTKAFNSNDVKKLEDYDQNKPKQLEFFFLHKTEDTIYSNTVELYDAIPKYYWGKVKRIEGKFLNSLHRKFKHRGVGYNVMVAPARIIDRRGKEKDCYPGLREELIEDALRKLFCEGQGIFLEDKKEKTNQAGVIFTLYELQQELKKRGHTYSIAEIKEALYVCSRTTINLKTETDEIILDKDTRIFETLGLQTQKDWKGHDKKTKAFVRFNSLVTKSIDNKTFRQLNYDKCMAYKNMLARWLHKRISHNYIQASPVIPYTINLKTIIIDSGAKAYAKISNNIRKVEFALDEMVKAEVLQEYKINLIYDAGRKNKIVDAKFNLYAHLNFAKEMRRSNKRYSEITEYANRESKKFTKNKSNYYR